MEAALGWLGDIVRGLLKFLPALVIIRTTHAGVVFWAFPWKCIHRVWKPGLHVYWPLIAEHEIIPVKRQTANYVTQTLTTKDLKAIKAGFILIYEIHDPLAYITDCWDGEDTIRDHALRAVAQKVGSTDFADLVADKNYKDLERDLRRDLKKFGVYTLETAFSDLAETTVFSGIPEFPDTIALQTETVV